MLLKIKQKNAVQHLKDLPVSCMCLPNTGRKFQRLTSGQHVRVEPVLTSQTCKKLSKIQMVLQLLVAILIWSTGFGRIGSLHAIVAHHHSNCA
jgi:hypothetical protein